MTLNAMNNSSLWVTWAPLGHELKALYAINSFGLLTSMTLGHELKALDAMSSSRLLMTWKTMGCELRAKMLWIALGCGWHQWVYVISSSP